ncbi:efflux RND transporter periplasmic adaptor subunit [Chitinophaga agri]|uniref:Efflux RND transporter periplasmic adaptor subunit n=1 Tax=Chitinophaga agri TaxID=2703787 RepID=A0A6B9ZQR1_9BACT|nr:efflux RND transporter periplasmic adaptor subunit [Chitinophaga agri]QHS63563.1 efflux RND transporter periplasmic adaptor subunit [Chitinophaga agri]
MRRLLLFLITGAALASCSNSRKEPEALKETEAHENTTIAEITQEQVDAVGIQTDTVQYRDLTNSIKANGMLNVPNQNKAIVTSVIDGVIKTLHVLPGDYVKQGQVIATLTNPSLAKTQQQLQATLAQIKLTATELHRQEELVQGNAAPMKNLQRVQTELTTLTSSRNALQQELAAMGVSVNAVANGKINTTVAITAPISGTISSVSAQIGSQVNASMPIAQIVNNSELHLDLFVYEKDLPLLKTKQSISFTLTNNPGQRYDAEIFSIGTAFENNTKTIPVHAVVKGEKSGLIEGMNVTGIINTGTLFLPAVPTEAIVSHAGQDYVFILQKKVSTRADKSGGDGTVYFFEKWAVAKGITDMGYTAITPVEPIPAGALLVTKGTFFVLAKLTNKGEEE